ncbi:MAG: acyloxyacyl hydrolase [Cryomorphaceae bacterium]|nr:acyloxyacyl hydrolase [Cryomorphaceae bacterium]
MKKVYVSYCLFLMLAIVVTFACSIYAQHKNLSLRGDLHFGAVLPEYSNFVYLVNEPVFSGEISLVKQSFGKNPFQNVSVGSHLNVHFNFKLGTKLKLSSTTWLNSGVSFTHYSNANMSEPNLGLNLATLYTGLTQIIHPTPERINVPDEAHQPKHEFAFILAAGGKHTRALQSTVYFTSSASIEYKHHSFKKLHFGGGLDLSYDSSTETEMSAPGKNDYKPAYDYRTGIHFSQELVYDRFSFILQEGLYFGLTDQVSKSPMYNRAILRWKLNPSFLVHVSMRSHLHILEYPEIGFGYFLLKQRHEK